MNPSSIRLSSVAGGHDTSLHGYQQIIEVVDTERVTDTRAEILLRLVVDQAVLRTADLRAATGRHASVYRLRDTVYAEWPRQSGYIDRRILSPRLAHAISRSRGLHVAAAGWQAALRTLREGYGNVDPHAIWEAFLVDASHWWSDHLTPPLLAHCLFQAPFQLLPRAALARRQIPGDCNVA